MADALHFAVCTFTRVFDTTPQQEAVTLEELAHALCRFELKPKVQAAIERDLARLDRAWAAWQGGDDPAGKYGSALLKAEATARRDGADGDALIGAVEARYTHLRAEIRKSAKREIRLWTPAKYIEGATRGSEHVEHVSCLVLDYDDGTPIAHASDRWRGFFHIVHTTWSHTPIHPKFRIILPLAHPVCAEEWRSVWDWAEARTGQTVDPALKGAGANFALPVVPRRDWPREAFVQPGALLDPKLEGIVTRPAEPIDPARTTTREFADGVADHTYIEPAESAPAVSDDALEDPEVWDVFDSGPELAAPVSAVVPPPPASDTTLDDIAGRLDGLAARIDALGVETMVDALERLATLHADGALTDAEFTAAKARALRGAPD
jgi:hypothetical protein